MVLSNEISGINRGVVMTTELCSLSRSLFCSCAAGRLLLGARGHKRFISLFINIIFYVSWIIFASVLESRNANMD